MKDLQEKIRTIAEYDGWSKREYQPVHNRELYDNDMHTQWLDSMSYHTDLNILHSVAMKVIDEFHSHKDWIENPTVEIVEKMTGITQSCSTKPTNGQYMHLLHAVYDGIIFLNTKHT